MNTFWKCRNNNIYTYIILNTQNVPKIVPQWSPPPHSQLGIKHCHEAETNRNKHFFNGFHVVYQKV